MFDGFKFIVVTMDSSSDIVMKFIETENLPPDIIVIDEEEFPDLGFVTDLDELHVFLADPCGRLSYIIVPPHRWDTHASLSNSILIINSISSAQHPYVKAALLSTITDLPCGCMPSYKEPETDTDDEVVDVFSHETESTSESSTSTLENIPVIDIDTDEVENIQDLLDNSNALNNSERDSSETELPLRIIIPSIHIHFDNDTQSYWKYDQFVLKTGNHSYHEHLQQGENLIELGSDNWKLENITKIGDKIFVGNRSISDIQNTAKGAKLYFDHNGKAYKASKTILGSENILEITPVDFDVVKIVPPRSIQSVQRHYEQLGQYLMFKV